jgi:hypothetical protein
MFLRLLPSAILALAARSILLLADAALAVSKVDYSSVWFDE